MQYRIYNIFFEGSYHFAVSVDGSKSGIISVADAGLRSTATPVADIEIESRFSCVSHDGFLTLARDYGEIVSLPSSGLKLLLADLVADDKNNLDCQHACISEIFDKAAIDNCCKLAA